jgi:hypothetical protein
VLARFTVNKPQVVYEPFDNEVVIMNLGSGNYYSTDKVGAEIWQSIVQGIALDDINDSIARRYDRTGAEIAREVNRFSDELQQENLIIPTQGDEIKVPGSATPHWNGNEKLEFEPPALHKYTDMKDMLLLDPIHEVDESGWPHAQVGSSKK